MSSMTVSEVEAIETSHFATEQYPWKTAPAYETTLNCSAAKFEDVSNVLLCQPQLNSSHLFRADILYDSAGLLQSPAQKEAALCDSVEAQQLNNENANSVDQIDWTLPISSSSITLIDLRLTRTVVRRLVPRKPKVDQALEQTCFMYSENRESEKEHMQRLVIYRPHVWISSEMPWYHPSVKALAFYFSGDASVSSLSVHFLPFNREDIDPIPNRLHRTMLSLLSTLLRLTKHDGPVKRPNPQDTSHENVLCNGMTSSMNVSMSNLSLAPSSLKDTIIPQHLVQDTYTRLKETYASDLIGRWVESTEPSKHVFEDLSIAAFLTELWKQMYPPSTVFPGFVDIACGNGVLVYILLKEGYTGSGFDARRRKTWEILDIEEHLTEQLCIPQPFLDALASTAQSILPGTLVHNGIFVSQTFIISNHADELTPWTPLLASHSSTYSPNPFLAIPCCSHALSGARHRYYSNNVVQTTTVDPDTEQPQAGDLKALRSAKKAVQGDDKSMYGCLTRKVATMAQEVGYSVELTLMRIPSTRNIGIVGNRKQPKTAWKEHSTIEEVIERECRILGGVEAAARVWVEKAHKLQTGKGRGKVNEKRHEHGIEDPSWI